MNAITITDLLIVLEDSGIQSDLAAVIVSKAEDYDSNLVADIKDYCQIVQTVRKNAYDEGFSYGREIGHMEYTDNRSDSFQDGWEAGYSLAKAQYERQVESLMKRIKRSKNNDD